MRTLPKVVPVCPGTTPCATPVPGNQMEQDRGKPCLAIRPRPVPYSAVVCFLLRGLWHAFRLIAAVLDRLRLCSGRLQLGSLLPGSPAAACGSRDRTSSPSTSWVPRHSRSPCTCPRIGRYVHAIHRSPISGSIRYSAIQGNCPALAVWISETGKMPCICVLRHMEFLPSTPYSWHKETFSRGTQSQYVPCCSILTGDPVRGRFRKVEGADLAPSAWIQRPAMPCRRCLYRSGIDIAHPACSVRCRVRACILQASGLSGQSPLRLQ